MLLVVLLNDLNSAPSPPSTFRDQVRAAIAKRLLAVLFDSTKGIGELLQGLSCVAYLLLILFRVNGTGFTTSQSYHDLQATVRGMFFVVQRAKNLCSGEKMYLWQVDSGGLENLFAVVRTLNHPHNVDLKELGERLGAAVAMQRVYSDHESWRRVSRRLNGPLDHMNTTTWTLSLIHI